MDYLDINAEEEMFSTKIIENVLNDINSKKILIRNFKEKYNIDYIINKEKNANIIIKKSDMNKILDSFIQIISISIKAISFLLIKLKNNKNSNNKNRHSAQIMKSYSSIYDTQQFFNIFKEDNYKSNKEKNKNNKKMNHFMKNNRSYNHILNKENNNNYFKIITNYEKYDNDLIIDNKNMYTYNKINDHKKRNHKKITIDTNYYNFMKNIQSNLNSSNNKNFISFGEKNQLLSSQNNTKYKNNFNLDNNKQKNQYIKINNCKLRIKSPIRQTLKEMINKQKKKTKILNYSTVNNKSFNLQNNKSYYKYKENKEEKKTDETRLNNNLNANDVNNLVINNCEFQIPSKIVSYNSPKCNVKKIPINNNKNNNYIYQKIDNEIIPSNIIKVNNIKNLYGLNTPNSQDNRIIKINDSNQTRQCNNNNISFGGRQNSYNKKNLKNKSFINEKKIFNYNQNIIKRCNKTFEN